MSVMYYTSYSENSFIPKSYNYHNELTVTSFSALLNLLGHQCSLILLGGCRESICKTSISPSFFGSFFKGKVMNTHFPMNDAYYNITWYVFNLTLHLYKVQTEIKTSYENN